jgi:16S rRNA (cytidine1402-2'-O)-methyltransferase
MSSFVENTLTNFIETGSHCKYPPGFYLVATPIGNMEDITLRALFTLNKADLIVCEDKRVTQKLLMRYGIQKPCLTYNDHATAEIREKILTVLHENKRVAFVSDAGMPLIADPGYKLVRSIIDAGIYLTCIPGPTASITALLLSGLSPDQFCFLGFFPRKASEANALFESLGSLETLVFYEAPTRLLKTLRWLRERSDIGQIAVGRELTKQFEEVVRGTPADVLAQMGDRTVKGEIVLIVQHLRKAPTLADMEVLLVQMLGQKSLKEAVEEVTHMTGISKKRVYQRALELKDGR